MRTAFLFAFLLVLSREAADAQQLINYTNGENDSTPIIITSGTDPTTLAVSLGSATQGGTISESGGSFAVTKSGTGTLSLTAANTYTGDTTVSAGTLAIGSGGSIGTSSGVNLANNGTTFDISGGGNQGILGLSGTSGSTVNLGANTLTISLSGTSTFAGSLQGSGGGFIKTNTGALVLSSANTYTGSTTISQGMLQFGKEVSLYDANSANWTAANISIATGATLALNVGGSGEFTSSDVTTLLQNLGAGSGGFANGSSIAFDTTNASGGNFTYSGTITDTHSGSNTLGLIVLGSNTVTLSSTNTFSGATTINSGATLAIGGAGTLGSGLYAGNIYNAGTFSYGSSAPQILSGTMSGNGVLVQNGPGTLTLSGTNTYVGDTTIAAGTLNVNGSVSAMSLVRIDTAGTLSGSGIVNGNASLSGNGVINFSSTGEILGGVNVYGGGNWNGAGTVAGVGTFFGGVYVSSGIFTIGPGANLTSPDGVNVADGGIASGSSSSTITGNVDYNSTVSSTFGGIIAGNGATLSVDYPGAYLALTGSNTYTGATTISAGTLRLDGSLAAGSNVALSGTGTLSGGGTVNGSATLGGNATINFTSTGKIAGTLYIANGSWNGAGSVNGQVALTNGTLTIGPGANLTANDGVYWESGNVVASNGLSTITGGLEDGSGAHSNFGGVLAGIGSTLSLENAGALLTLSGTNANTYTGLTTITLGELDLNKTGVIAIPGNLTIIGANGQYDVRAKLIASNQIATSSTITIQNGGVFDLNGQTNTVATLDIGGGTISSSTSGGILTVATALNFSGTTVIQPGATLDSNVPLTLTQAAIVVYGTLDDSVNVEYEGTLAGLGVVTGTTDMYGGLINSLGLTLDGLVTFHGSSGNTLTGTVTALDGVVIDDSSTVSQTSGTLISSIVDTSSGSSTFAGVITGNGNSVTLNNVSGTLSLTGPNSYTGGTVIEDGVLSINAVATVGTAQPLGENTQVTFSGASSSAPAVLQYTGGSGTLGQNLTVSTGAFGIIENTGGGTLTVAGVITKANSTMIFSEGIFDVTGQITGGTSTDFNSDLVVNNGATVTLDNVSNNYSGPTDIYGGGTLKDGAGTIPNGTVLNLGDPSDGASTNTFDLNGNNQTLAAINSLGNSGATNINLVTNSAASGINTLTLTGENSEGASVVSNFSGSIQDGATAQTAVQISGGTHIFSGNDTYSGGTTISGGTLEVSADDNLGAAPNVSNPVVGGITFSGGELLTTSSFATDRTITITDTGTLAASIGTTLSYGGTISGGTLTIGDGTNTGTIVFSHSTTITGTVGSIGIDSSGGGTGGTALDLYSDANFMNNGRITGGAGGDDYTGGPGGSGGQGGTAANTATGASFINNGTITGGNGGGGGNGSDSFYDTNGGVGGVGTTLASNANLTNIGTITGGNGSNGVRGGDGGTAVTTNTGAIIVNTGIISGGSGGSGIIYNGISGAGGVAITLATGANLTNNGTITGGSGGDYLLENFSTGGTGGAAVTMGTSASLTNTGTITGGTGGMYFAYNGQGIIASGNDTIINAGGLASGTGPDTEQADAIDLSGGGNTLELYSTSNITGNVVSSSGTTNSADTLELGGTTDGTFAVSNIGSSAQYQGFANYIKTGASTWTLTGATTTVTPWTINAGALNVAGSLTGPVTITSGGTLFGTGSIGGALTLNGGGSIQLTGANSALGLTVGGLTLGNVGAYNSTNYGILDFTGGTNGIEQLNDAFNTLTSNNVYVDVLGSLADGTYTLATFDTTPINNFSLSDSQSNISSLTVDGITYAINDGTTSDALILTVSGTNSDGQTAQSITFPTIPTQLFGVAPFTLNATAPGGNVTFSVVSGPANITVSGGVSTITLTGGGLVQIQATQPGNATYSAATPVTQSFAVNLPFDAWESQYSQLTDLDPAHDPEGDGVPTLLKYVYDIDPSQPMSASDRTKLATVETTAETQTLIFNQYGFIDPIVIVQVEISSDMITWTPVVNGTNGTITTVALPGGDLTVTTQVPITTPTQFIRLNVALP